MELLTHNTAIPITEGCVFALHLDTEREQEHIIIGERQIVQRFLRGDRSARVLTEVKRPFGDFILDCSKPIAGTLADIRAILSDNTGKKKTPYFERSKELLAALWQSNNLVHRFTAIRIWQEYNRACGLKKYDLYGAVEEISLPLMTNLENDITEWQESAPQDPLGELDELFFKQSASVMYAKGKALKEYWAADISVFPLVVYYLKTVYNRKTYVQACKRCGRLFRAKTANIPTFCSDACKKEQNRLNKQRFDAKAKVTGYEQEYRTQYMYWYNRVKKLRQTSSGTDRLKKAEEAFKAFCKEAVKRKKAVADGKAEEADFRNWMFEQGRVIDRVAEAESEY